MKVVIENFCLVKFAELDLNSISVIGAENDTGKSTIGKVLFGIFYSVETYKDFFLELASYKLDNIFDKISLKNKLLDSKESNKHLKKIDQIFSFESNLGIYREEIINKQRERKIEILNELKSELDEHLKDYLYNNAPLNLLIVNNFKDKYLLKGENTYDNDEKEEISKELESVKILFKSLSDREFLIYYKIKDFYKTEISNTIKNFNNKEQFTKIKIKENTYQLKMKVDDEYLGIEEITNLNKIKDIIYIESPLFLDIKNENESSFRKNLRGKLQNKKPNLETQVFIDFKENISKLINSIILGKLFYDEKDNTYKFRRSNEELKMSAVASGIKSFGIISLLLENNHLTKDTILIIDEPEVHLHPKWQIKYAEILCLLAKKIGLKILVNSHSPYFIEAISVYSELKEYDLEKTVKFYSFDCYDDGNILVDKTDSLSEIYEKLAEPYQILNDKKYKEAF